MMGKEGKDGRFGSLEFIIIIGFFRASEPSGWSPELAQEVF